MQNARCSFGDYREINLFSEGIYLTISCKSHWQWVNIFDGSLSRLIVAIAELRCSIFISNRDPRNPRFSLDLLANRITTMSGSAAVGAQFREIFTSCTNKFINVTGSCRLYMQNETRWKFSRVIEEVNLN